MITITSLAAGYGQVQVLRDISLKINANEIVAILGSNGVGKTTLNNTISGLIKPTSGRIEFEGKDITGLDPQNIVDLGLIHVPEGRKLFPNLNVKENLEMGSYRRGKPNRAVNIDMVLDVFRGSKTAFLSQQGHYQVASSRWLPLVEA